jgi:hypothetical protein
MKLQLGRAEAGRHEDAGSQLGRNEVVANLIFFKAVYALSLFGAASGIGWLGSAALVFFLAWHILNSETARADLIVAAIAVAIGFTVDSLYLRSGLIAYSGEVLWTGFAPLWIVALWANLALTLNGCLRWMQSRLALTAGLFLVLGPFGYFIGGQIGAATVTGNPVILYGLVAIVWATALPLLLVLSARIRERYAAAPALA